MRRRAAAGMAMLVMAGSLGACERPVVDARRQPGPLLVHPFPYGRRPLPWRMGPGGGLLGSRPRLIANLAASAGPCTVCVRNIRSDDGRTSLTAASPAPGRPLGRFWLVLQLVPPAGDPADYTIDTASVRVRDDSGREVAPLPTPGPLAGATATGAGAAYLLRMAEPAPGARTLDLVAGRVVRQNGNAASWPFSIRRVPLPNGPVVYGDVAPRDVAGDAAPPGLAVLQDAAMDRVMARSSPPAAAERLPRQELLLPSGSPASVGVPSPAGPRHIEIKASADVEGQITVDVSADGRSWRGALWDHAPFLLVMPAAPGQPRRALALRLSTGPPTTEPESLPVSPFPPSSDQPGGAIASRVLVDGRSFGEGRLPQTVQRREGAGWSLPRSLTVAVGEDGRYVVPNLAAGTYRLARPASGLAPRYATLDLSDYLRRRFGAAMGTWDGERLDGIVVRPGQTTDTPPLRWVPSRPAAAPRPAR